MLIATARASLFTIGKTLLRYGARIAAVQIKLVTKHRSLILASEDCASISLIGAIHET
jgi:hypothetical protein